MSHKTFGDNSYISRSPYAQQAAVQDEYAAGMSAWYTTNSPMLQRGIELIQMLCADLEHLGPGDQTL